MIGRKSDSATDVESAKRSSFDDFDLRLGDIMRGERATMGKSLLDVQRELRIKASYIAAIENCDPSAFDTPGFIAGYVRSYARYLDLDPDEAFAQFCAESGFAVAHGMSEQASTIRKPFEDRNAPVLSARDPFEDGTLPFAPQADSVLSRIEPRAIGSSLVLLALIGGIGYGGWSVLQEVQRVQVAPVDQTPIVLSDLDPLENVTASAPTAPSAAVEEGSLAGVFTPPSNPALDRLYRPQALDVPVLVARDAPISTLDPESVGVFARATPPGLAPQQDITDAQQRLAAQAIANAEAQAPAVVAASNADIPATGVTLIAARDAWIRVREGRQTPIYADVLKAGAIVTIPEGATDVNVRVGDLGAVYFVQNGKIFGPAGARGQVKTITLNTEDLSAQFALADVTTNETLATTLASLGPVQTPSDAPTLAQVTPETVDIPTALPQPTPLPTLRAGAPTLLPVDENAPTLAAAPRSDPPQPQVFEDGEPKVTIVAVREAWVRVKAPSGATVHEAIMQPGDTYTVPQMAAAPTVRTGDAGAVYFAVNGQAYGPYGSNGQIADNLAMSADVVTAQFQPADPSANDTLAKTVAELNAAPALPIVGSGSAQTGE